MRIAIIIILLFVGCSHGFGQNTAKKDLEKALNVFKSASSLRLVIDMKVYKSSSKKQLVYNNSIEVLKQNTLFIKKIGSIKTVRVHEGVLLIDSEQKRIDFQDRRGVEEPELQMDANFVDSLVDKINSRVELVSSNESLTKYRITNIGDFERIEFEISKSNKFLKKVIYVYKKSVYPTNNYIELNYNFSSNYRISPNQLLLSNYLKKSGKVWSGVGDFSEYSVNYTNAKEQLKKYK